jgi:hypothetical protein
MNNEIFKSSYKKCAVHVTEDTAEWQGRLKGKNPFLNNLSTDSLSHTAVVADDDDVNNASDP